jgi:hypothetical protein
MGVKWPDLMSGLHLRVAVLREKARWTYHPAGLLLSNVTKEVTKEIRGQSYLGAAPIMPELPAEGGLIAGVRGGRRGDRGKNGKCKSHLQTLSHGATPYLGKIRFTLLLITKS